MEIKLGPVLALQASSDETWTVSALVSFAGSGEPPELVWWGRDMHQPERVPPDAVDSFEGPGGDLRTVARYMLELDRGEQEHTVDYHIDGGDRRWAFVVPARGAATLRIGYASCNGFSHVKTERDTEDKYNRWDDFLARHEKVPMHVLMLGGDQVYGDPIWERAKPVRDWAGRDEPRKWKAPYSERLAKAVRRFYGELYEDRWNRGPLPRVLAEVPSLMMWDDHDIFDGWGSHSAERTDSPVYRGIFEEAERHFRVFQLQNAGGAPGRQALCPEHNHTYGMRIGSIAVLALDMRTERRPDRVISPEAWRRIYGWLDALPADVTHLLVMSSVPVVHLDFAAAEKALALVPGKQNLEDDFRDHWLSRPHQQERLRLIHRLFDRAQRSGTRVTILSGDIHVAGMGVIEDRRDARLTTEEATITQLISSPVVHPTPPQMLLYAYDTLNFFEGEQEDEPGIYSRMVKLPASSHRFIGTRNWLELEVEPADKARLWANWRVEEDAGQGPYTAVVHKVGRRAA